MSCEISSVESGTLPSVSSNFLLMNSEGSSETFNPDPASGSALFRALRVAIRASPSPLVSPSRFCCSCKLFNKFSFSPTSCSSYSSCACLTSPAYSASTVCTCCALYSSARRIFSSNCFESCCFCSLKSGSVPLWISISRCRNPSSRALYSLSCGSASLSAAPRPC